MNGGPLEHRFEIGLHSTRCKVCGYQPTDAVSQPGCPAAIDMDKLRATQDRPLSTAEDVASGIKGLQRIWKDTP